MARLNGLLDSIPYPPRMPIYSTHCPSCGVRDSVWRSVAERDKDLLCSCGARTSRIIDKPMIQAEITPYESPNTGRLISSRAEMRADLARSNAIPWEPGIEKDIKRKGEYEKEKAFRPIADSVDSLVRDLNVAGKLENLNA